MNAGRLSRLRHRAGSSAKAVQKKLLPDFPPLHTRFRVRTEKNAPAPQTAFGRLPRESGVHFAIGFGRSVFPVMAEGSKALRLQIGVDETIEIAVHDSADIAVFVTGAVILYERVGHKHIGTDLAAPGNLF